MEIGSKRFRQDVFNVGAEIQSDITQDDDGECGQNFAARKIAMSITCDGKIDTVEEGAGSQRFARVEGLVPIRNDGVSRGMEGDDGQLQFA